MDDAIRSSVAGSVASACCSSVFTPLERQIGYVAKVDETVEDLVRAMRDLKARSVDVAKRIKDESDDPTRAPTNEVEVWLKSVEEIEEEVNFIKTSYEKIRCRCLCDWICSNWKIGRKATYVLLSVNGLSQRVKDFVIVTRAGSPPPGQQQPGTPNLVAMEFNRKMVLNSLSAADSATDIKARTIGIYGMGGVGKTTLLKAVNNQLCSGGGGGGMAFKHVIWLVVSSNASIEKLQKDIVDFLELGLPENATSEMRRKNILNFLNDKKFILLLDDVWERLDLDGVGIPDHRRFVLFTTRSEEVCGQMEAGKKIKVECLQKEDAWRLFVDTVGAEIIRSSTEIKNLAEEVAKECEGLPLALTVLGRSMASKRTPSEWRNTLASLKKSQPGTSDMEKHLFSIIKYSYDSLRDDAARRCFLFCALYPEDYSFDIDELIKCFWGHGLVDVDGCSNYGEIYDLLYDKVVGVLRSACLLEVDDDAKVKMHDVIRDVALWISCDCGRNNTQWVVRAGLKSEEPLKGVPSWEMGKYYHFNLIG